MTLLFDDDHTEGALLAGIPRVGERIRRKDDVASETGSLVVEHVLWVEGSNPGLGRRKTRRAQPSVVVIVSSYVPVPVPA